PAASAAPVGASSVCTPTTPGTWRGATIPSADGSKLSWMAEVLAAVDCGTNSTRLLVSEAGERTLERLMRITRLGQGVDATGALDPAAVDRTVDVLREYRAVMDRSGVGRVRMTATSAARDAGNREDFFAQAEDVARARPTSRDAKRFVGLAGTVSTVAAVEQGLAEYDRDRIHHFVLTRAAAEDVFRTLATESRADRVHNPGLEEARADVIVGGTAILCAVMRFFQVPSLLVSEADILDGLAMSLSRTGG